MAWGVNWPDGFAVHHPDEYTHLANANAIITPVATDLGPPYPKALAAMAAAPFLIWYAAQGSFGGPRVHIPWIVGAGRLTSVLFALASLLVVYAIGRDALGDERAGVLGAWLLALGGLHVSHSHFFVADVPAATWMLLAAWLLWRDLARSRPGDHEALRWAAFATGAAIAFKLFVFVVPALVCAVLLRAPRASRLAHAAVFGVAGLFLPSLGFDGPITLQRTLAEGVNVPYEFDRLRGALLYGVQLPAIFSLPLLVVAAAGTWSLVVRLRGAAPQPRRHALLVFGSVPAVGLAFVLLKLDHFPRHWVFLIPWAAVAGGWFLSRLAERLRVSGRRPALVLAPLFLWMLAFVADEERFFLFEPRNDARRWLTANVPEGASVHWTRHPTPAGYRAARWPGADQPDVLVVEMAEANNYLSGVNWRDSYPTDPRQVFDGRSVERVAEVQALFRGSSPYTLVARFPAGFVMPERRAARYLIGDRAPSSITDVLVFRRGPDGAGAPRPPEMR